MFQSDKPPVTINNFLLSNSLLIKNNPAISPDMTLDLPSLHDEIMQEAKHIAVALDTVSLNREVPELQGITVWPKSEFSLGNATMYVVESKRSGDCALITTSKEIPEFTGSQRVNDSLTIVPLYWNNLIALKNAVQEQDPSSTIFPIADSYLRGTSLGIGARFTTMHWPAVAWVMKTLGVPLTANQNSIPRELVYDVNAMLASRLQKVPFPFIGGSVPEGHQGQSVQGMSHASIITLLKHGFHRNGIPWGFNADHQPIGGHYDEIENELVEGSLFASYITYDLSPELSLYKPVDDLETLEAEFNGSIEPSIYDAVVRRLSSLGLEIPDIHIKKMLTYLMPAMEKMKRRDQRYVEIRRRNFTTEIGRNFIRELSIDELPGETKIDTFVICLALTEAMGVRFDFIAPNFGFQKNIPYADNDALRKKIRSFVVYARMFGVSIGFHSGSGKSADNYRLIGEETEGRFEIKTSGRYTYEMGTALSQSPSAEDQKLWQDWYEFAKELAITSAFAPHETQRRFAREFITNTLKKEGIATDNAFESPEALKKVLNSLQTSPEHIFWFEYNFLFVLAAQGRIDRLGDHSPDGYRQRKRFYSISNQGMLLYSKRVASYILFLAESTGISNHSAVEDARSKLAEFNEYRDLLADIG